MWQQFEYPYNVLSLFEILSPVSYLNVPKRRLSVFEALSSEINSDKSMSRASSDSSLASYTESKHLEKTREKNFLNTEDQNTFEIGKFSMSSSTNTDNIFSMEDFKDFPASEAPLSKSRSRRRSSKGVKESGTSKKKKFRKVADPLSEDIAKQLFFDHSTKYSLVIARKMESSLLENVEPN